MSHVASSSLRHTWLFAASIFVILSALLYQAVPNPQAHFEVDSRTYERFATLFESQNSFIDPADHHMMPPGALGYSFFLGLLYKAFGHHYAMIIVVQIVLMLVCLYLLYRFAAHWFRPEIAGIAIVLAACNIGFLVYPQFLLTETLLMTCLLAFSERFAAFVKLRSLNALAMAGLFLGLSVLVKPVGLYFAPLVVALLFCVSKKMESDFLRASALFLALFSLPLAGYAMRNKVVHGVFRVCPLAKISMYYYYLPRVLARVHGAPEEQFKQQIEAMYRGNNSLRDEGWEEIDELFWNTLRQHPRHAAFVWLKNVLKTYVGLFTTPLKVLLEPDLHGGDCSFFKMQGSALQRAMRYITFGTQSATLHAIGFFEAFFLLVRYVAAALALYFLWSYGMYLYFAFMVAYIGYFSCITGHEGGGRFRMMFEFVLLLLAAIGFYIMYRRLVDGKMPHKREVVSS